MEKQTMLLIIGAGPFGLAMSAYAKHLKIDHIIVGKQMEFWKNNMPEGMLLRSSCDWHIDPENLHSIDKFLEVNALTCQWAKPISRQFYLSYVQWFTEEKHIDVLPLFVQQLNYSTNGYTAVMNDESIIHAKFVVIAVGFK